MAAIPRVFLHAGQERRITLGHPWAYSNEIRMDAEAKSLAPGTIATLHRSDGKPLGVGSFNPHTLIAFRSFDPDAGSMIDEGFFGRRLCQAMRLRDRLFPEPYYRLAHAEADGLPGLVCDRFGDVLVLADEHRRNRGIGRAGPRQPRFAFQPERRRSPQRCAGA